MKRPVNSTSVSICSSDDGTCTNTKTNDNKIKRTICQHNASTAKTHQQYAGSHQHNAKLALCKYLYPHKISKIHHLSAYCQPVRSSAYCQTHQRRTIRITCQHQPSLQPVWPNIASTRTAPRRNIDICTHFAHTMKISLSPIDEQ